jgi:hypothetical protein
MYIRTFTTIDGREFSKNSEPLAEMWEIPSTTSSILDGTMWHEHLWYRQYALHGEGRPGEWINASYTFMDRQGSRPMLHFQAGRESTQTITPYLDHRYTRYVLEIKGGSQAVGKIPLLDRIQMIVDAKKVLEDTLEARWNAGRFAERYISYAASSEIYLSEIQASSPLLLDEWFWSYGVHDQKRRAQLRKRVLLTQITNNEPEYKELSSLPDEWLSSIAL